MKKNLLININIPQDPTRQKNFDESQFILLVFGCTNILCTVRCRKLCTNFTAFFIWTNFLCLPLQVVDSDVDPEWTLLYYLRNKCILQSSVSQKFFFLAGPFWVR